jgi:tetratricopeptide (TPR) repeat protein
LPEIALAKTAARIADYQAVEQVIQLKAVRRALPGIALLIATVMIYHAARFWLADHRVHKDNLESIESGVHLEPGDADAWDTLGRFLQFSLEYSDPARSLAAYQNAVAANPHSSILHLNLAAAYEGAGKIEQARGQYVDASNVYPLSALVAWNYGNFLLRQGETAEGYAQIRKAILADRSLLTLASSRVWRASRDVNVLLEEVLPADADAYEHALDYFSSIHQTSASLAVWDKLVALGQPLPLSKSFPLIEALIQTDDSSDAERVWRDALKSAGIPYSAPLNHSLIWNGNFLRDFENGGLDWRYDPIVGVSLDFDTVPPGHDGRSLRMEFGGGNNTEIDKPVQHVPVEPNHRYHFRATMRTEDITTEMGLRFFISDENHPNGVDVMTENLTGSNPWRTVTAEFNTGPDTHFVAVRLRRQASRLFENRLSGTVWISDIYLLPSELDSEQPAK